MTQFINKISTTNMLIIGLVIGLIAVLAYRYYKTNKCTNEVLDKKKTDYVPTPKDGDTETEEVDDTETEGLDSATGVRVQPKGGGEFSKKVVIRKR